MDGVDLPLQGGMAISGRVALSSTGGRPNQDVMSGLRVRLRRIEVNRGAASVVGSVQPSVDGAFTFKGLPPGRYSVFAVMLPTASGTWTPESSLLGEQETQDNPLELRPGENISGLRIGMTDSPTELVLRVPAWQGLPVADLSVLVFAEREEFRFPGCWRQRGPLNVGPDGSVTDVGLPPGTYFVALNIPERLAQAIEGSLLEDLSRQGVRVTIGPGQKQTVVVGVRAGSLP
jgi:hypothetical protein